MLKKSNRWEVDVDQPFLGMDLMVDISVSEAVGMFQSYSRCLFGLKFFSK